MFGMRRVTLMIVIALAVCVAASATTVTYTSRPGWNAAIVAIPVTGTLTEDFSDNIVNQTWLSVSSTAGSAGGFQWNDEIKDDPLQTTTWSWAGSPPMVAFGGDFDLEVPGGPGSGIDIWANFAGSGWAFVLAIPNTATIGDFYGFTSTVAFTDVRFEDDGLPAGWTETYNMDNLSYAWVPEPSTYMLIGAGLLGMAFWRRRKSAS